MTDIQAIAHDDHTRPYSAPRLTPLGTVQAFVLSGPEAFGDESGEDGVPPSGV